MSLSYAASVLSDFPELVSATLIVDGVHAGADVGHLVEPFIVRAKARLAGASEAEFPEIQAWRRAFSRMGLKPTQYRCASEALLRRLRQDGALPSLHPLVDFCNAVSVAFAIPVAVFDRSRIAGGIEVRPADGDETYETFQGAIEQPHPREIIFADAERRVHARRWTNRQSGLSAVRATTTTVLIVAEALHDQAEADVPRLIATLTDGIATAFPGCECQP